MYLGQIVEVGPAERVLNAPAAPVHAGLAARPISEPDPTRRDRRKLLVPGEIPSPRNPPPACRFHTRCPLATQICKTETPPLAPIEAGHAVACHHWEQVRAGAAGARRRGARERRMSTLDRRRPHPQRSAMPSVTVGEHRHRLPPVRRGPRHRLDRRRRRQRRALAEVEHARASTTPSATRASRTAASARRSAARPSPGRSPISRPTPRG